MSSVRTVRDALVGVSRRYSRVAHEVEDLAHDIIVSALRRGSPLESDAFLQSLHGAARRHGAFLARSAGRRRAREAYVADPELECGEEDTVHDEVEGEPLSALPPALATTLRLLLAGLEKAELRYALGVSDAALRKRFEALRARGLARPEQPEAMPARPELRRSQVALLPRLAAALDVGERAPRVLAARDPDGHGIIFTEVLTPGRPTATPETSPATVRAPSKGNPC